MVSRRIAAGFIVIFCSALMFVPNETFGRSGGGFSGRSSSGTSTSHSSTMSRPPIHAIAHSIQHHRKADFGGLFFGPGFYGSGTYYVPWDAAHRNPPIDIDLNSSPSNPQSETGVTSSISDRYQVYVYRPGCSSETVTVPWDDGKEHSINIVRG